MKSRKLLSMAGAVATAVILAAMLAVPASAAQPEWFTLHDDASPAAYAFKVYSPGVTSLEAEYLNFTIYSDPVVSGQGTEANWYVLVYLNDGTTNYSWNKTLAVVNDARVYSNISMASPGTTFVENGTADLYIRLQKANWAFKDNVSGSFGIYATEMGAVLGAFIPLIITVAIFAAIIPMVRKIGGKAKR